MFRGITAVSLDEKGRMAMPTKYRNPLRLEAESQLVATIDTGENCLLLYPLPAWEEIEQHIEALPSFNQEARRIQRLLIGHATEITLDNQGRLLLPQTLREYADLDKHVVLVGQGKKFEIWCESLWYAHREHWLHPEETDREIPDALRSLSL